MTPDQKTIAERANEEIARKATAWLMNPIDFTAYSGPTAHADAYFSRADAMRATMLQALNTKDSVIAELRAEVDGLKSSLDLMKTATIYDKQREETITAQASEIATLTEINKKYHPDYKEVCQLRKTVAAQAVEVVMVRGALKELLDADPSLMNFKLYADEKMHSDAIKIKNAVLKAEKIISTPSPSAQVIERLVDTLKKISTVYEWNKSIPDDSQVGEAKALEDVIELATEAITAYRKMLGRE